jgi:hypothetical protein
LFTSSGVVRRAVLAHQPGAVDLDRAVADRQQPADLLAGQAFDQAARRSRVRAASARPSTGRREDRSSKVQMPAACGLRRFSARPVTWHQNSLAVAAFHHPVVGIVAAGVEDRERCVAPVRSNSSLAGVEQLEGLADQLLARAVPNMSSKRWLQSTISRWRDSTRPIGARSKASAVVEGFGHGAGHRVVAEGWLTQFYVTTT